MNTLTIGQVARQTGVGVDTLRYYEREGLVEEPPRRESGYRQYPEEVVKRIHFIKRAQELGFSLKEIAELFALRVDPTTPSREVKRRAEAKLADIERKIGELLRMKRALEQITHLCTGQGPISECPILDVLDQ
ncbi:heavy metal-responsive transcriptional regulator [Ktedonobacteria bacterium brp13]|nr:heavy metal-responsive transcriptional regulator [Ktedonobacteria bacterium brp13]